MTSPFPGRREVRPAPEPAATEGRGAAARQAPWVWTRLRATPSATLLGAVLAFVAVLLATALPRALDRSADQALRDSLHAGGPARTSLYASAESRPDAPSPQDLDEQLATMVARTGPSFRLAASGPVHGAIGDKPRTLANPELAVLDEQPPQANLLFLPRAADHARLVEGRWPGGGTTDGRVPVALSKTAADTLKAKVGTVLKPLDGLSLPVTAEVVGLYTVEDPSDVYWTDLACATKACMPAKACTTKPCVPPSGGWLVSALVGPDALDRIAPWGHGSRDFWRLPVDTGRLRADTLPRVTDEISALVAGPTASGLSSATGRPDLRITSEILRLFGEVRARQQAAAPLAAIGPAGLGGVALVVFCLAAGLAGDRRQAELLLLRARGGSRAGILRRLLAEGAVTVLPAAVLAAALSLVLLPTPRLAPALLAAGAVTLVALSAFPVRAFVLLSAPRGRAPRRRLVAELLVLAATVAAVAEVRRRGVAPAGAGLDPLLVAAPLLIALSGGLVLARIQPPAVRVLAWAGARRAGVVGFLGLARAARGSGGRTARPSVLPLIALLLAVTTGGFGAAVLTAVEGSRLQVARSEAGGDVQVVAPPGETVPKGFARAAGALPGVRTSLGVWVDTEAHVFDTDRGSVPATVVVAEPAAYAELARTAGRGGFDPAVLGGADGGAPVPALFSGDLSGRAPDRAYRVRLRNGADLQVRQAAVVDGTPARPGAASATIVLPAGPVTARVPQAADPTHWFAVGRADAERVRGLIRESAPASADRFLVHTSTEVAARLDSGPLQHAAGRLFGASLAGAAGFALLAVLLGLVRAAPERGALLARLRTMGLRPRQGIVLVLTESLPQVLAAALGGFLTAAAAVAVLGASVDLSALVGADVPAGLRLTAPPVLVPALGMAALAALAVLAEAAVSGRRQIITELRAGDQR
ncbi:hypothetical protein [Streptomyces sp. Isolate_45]|uniref:hypothetical protein n=1 Tax=Streptomyces sp. Isolate_45 TaxID=2950111 RepID=UPI002481F92E|nr:hypothetical protein [Streptomyces sp. Isolate_45]MDA5283654.1 hypothetical protein [Streptomyces sp. Isolate_45]